MAYHFKNIIVVPSSSDFIDIVLSKTQRKTPTVVHPNYAISRIRQFYMRKVKFAQEAFNEKLDMILTHFPKLDDIHPFYSDLLNVLYDKDHYKVALGQLNTARHLIENLSKEYVKLLKFGDSLYRCKQLKRAALGRMATICKGLKDSLSYLEQVRQHLSRLPSIDPNTRTLLICGYPNVGKSSFMNKVTRADVDVQPYAFTTKSLFVGHMDYNYVRWQVIDTPGILDHPLEDRNVIEMQSITAMAHIKASILYFMDLSQECGYSIEAQVALFHSITPLFANKPVILVINKIDLRRYEDLDPNEKQMVDSCLLSNVTMLQQSCYLESGVIEVRNLACEKLLQQRVEVKLQTTRVREILGRLNVAIPQPRDNKVREVFCPFRSKYNKDDEMKTMLEKDLEEENGGAGVYNVDLSKNYIMPEEWKHDVIPELMDGKNFADFFDADIEEKLMLLELEEERLQAEGAYDIEMQKDDGFSDLQQANDAISAKQLLLKQARKIHNPRNRKSMPMQVRARSKTVQQLKEQLKHVEVDIDEHKVRSHMIMRRKLETKVPQGRDKGVSVGMGVSKRSADILRRAQFRAGLAGKAGTSDRKVYDLKPKHLFTGKRGIGKTSHR